MLKQNSFLYRRALLSSILGTALFLSLPNPVLAHDVKDPVCRMTVDSDTTPFKHKIGGKTFYLCSAACQKTFSASPARYTKLASKLEKSAGGNYGARVSTNGPALAGKPTTLSIKIVNENTKKIVRDFELTHEKRMHFLLVSEDMKWFAHEHPELQKDGVFRLRTTFPRPGRYHLYADCTPSDGDNQILRMPLTVGGSGTPIVAASDARPLVLDKITTRRVGNLSISVAVQPTTLRKDQAAILTYTIRESQGRPVRDLEPYLGAMGHLMAIRQDGREIVHTHALHAVTPGAKPVEESGLKLTSAMSTASGPAFSFKVSLPTTGLYRIWAQFQRRGEVITVPFTFRVADIWEEAPVAAATVNRPMQRATIRVENGVYSPARVTVAAGKPVELTFVGGKSIGCGDTLVFPDLGIKKTLSAGGKTVVSFTPKKSGPVRFSCGMNMYRGQIQVTP